MTESSQLIWNAYYGKLLAFISRRVPNSYDAEDIVQEVFLKLHMHLGTVRSEEATTGWIYQVARNAVSDYYRKRRISTEDISQYTDKADETETFEELDSPEKFIASGLFKMIDNLPAKYAQAVLMADLHKIPQVEISEKLGMSISGVKSRVQRGRAMLREALLKCCCFEFDPYGTIIDFKPACCCHAT